MSNRSTSDPSADVLFLHHDEAAVAKSRRFLAQLATIRDLVAPLIIAHSVEEGDDWIDAVASLVEPNAERIRDDVQALDERLHGEGVSADVFDPWCDDPTRRGPLGEAVISLSGGYGRAGYLLGLAVGSLHGGHAFVTPGGKVGGR